MWRPFPIVFFPVMLSPVMLSLAVLSLAVVLSSRACGASFDSFYADAGKAMGLSNAGDDDAAWEICERLLADSKGRFAQENPVDVLLFQLAKQFKKKYRLDEAEKLCRRALEICESKYGGDDARTNMIRADLAATYGVQQTEQAAIEGKKLYRLILESQERTLGKDHLQTALTLKNLGVFLARNGFYEEAIEASLRALEIRKRRLEENDPAIVSVLSDLGVAYKETGHYAEAEKRYLEALEIVARQGKGPWENLSTLYNNIGTLYIAMHRYAEAEKFLLQSKKIREETLGEKAPQTINAMTNLAGCYLEQGRFLDAEPLYRHAVELYTGVYGPKHFYRTVPMQGLASVLVQQGRSKEAAELYLEVAEIILASTGKENPALGKALNSLAALHYEQGDHKSAVDYFEKALAIFVHSLGFDHPETARCLNNLAIAVANLGRIDEAEQAMFQALKIREAHFGPEAPQLLSSLNSLGNLYFRQARYDEAERMYDRAFAVHDGYGAENGYVVPLFKNRADLYRATGRNKDAVAELKKAMDISASTRKHASGDAEDRARAFAGFYHLFETMVDWQCELGDMNEAYDALERSRAQGLQDLIHAHGIDFLEGVPENVAGRLRAREAEAQNESASLERQIEYLLARTDMSAPAKAKAKEKLESNLKQAHERLESVENAIKAESPFYRMMIGRDRKPVPLDTIRKVLEEEKTVALEYLVGPEKSFLFVYGFGREPRILPLVLNENEARIFGVDSGTLDDEKLGMILQNGEKCGVLQVLSDAERVPENGVPDVETMAKLAVLWRVLVPEESLRKELLRSSVEKILIMPDGPLAKLPFEALVVEPDTTHPQYLLDRGAAIHYVPSASMYFNLRQHGAGKPGRSALTVGDPVYDNAAANRSRLAARFTVLERLPETTKETEWVEESFRRHGFDVVRLDKATSTEANVRKNVAGKRFVHLACHGYAVEEFGGTSAELALTIGDPGDPGDDGFLTLAEMFALDLGSCEWAILSACQTNLGPNEQGEGTWSMGRGMLAAGACRVVTTDWNVDDEATSRLVRDFVRKVNETSESNIVPALHQVKKDCRNNRENPRWNHPYYWAPFILMGP